MKRILITLTVMALAASAARADAPAWDDSGRIAGSVSGISKARTAVVEDQDAWNALWAEHVGSLPEAPPAPKVEFDKEFVVGAFIGLRRSGGQEVALELSPTETVPPVLWVSVKEKKTKDFAITMMTQPFALRKVPKAYASVRFVKGATYQLCKQCGTNAGDEETEEAAAAPKGKTVAARAAIERWDGVSGGNWVAQAPVIFDGKSLLRDAVGSVVPFAGKDKGFVLTQGLPPPPGSKDKKKQDRGKGLPPPPKKDDGKKLPPPPGTQDGKPLPPPPQEDGKPLPPPPGVRIPEPLYPGGPLPKDEAVLRNAERTYTTYGKRYIGYWIGDRYWKKSRGTVNVSPDDRTNAYTMKLESGKYREYIKFYYDPDDGSVTWMPYEKFLDKTSKRLEIVFGNRAEKPLYPWESESFTFVLAGSELGLESANGAYEYDVATTVSTRDTDRVYITMTATDKKRTTPDKNGVSVGIKKVGNMLKLAVNDKWAQYYSGETLEISLTIKRTKDWWVDPTIKSISRRSPLKISVGALREVDIMSLAGQKSGEYYLASWSFRRANSKISAGVWMSKGKGNAINK